MQLSPGIQSNLQYNQQQVYDIIAVYCCFYDDCSVANTTVIGKAADVAFKTTGKVILQKDGALFLKIPTQRKRSRSITRLYQAKRTHQPSF
jgi:DNA topoisomerase-3